MYVCKVTMMSQDNIHVVDDVNGNTQSLSLLPSHMSLALYVTLLMKLSLHVRNFLKPNVTVGT